MTGIRLTLKPLAVFDVENEGNSGIDGQNCAQSYRDDSSEIEQLEFEISSLQVKLEAGTFLFVGIVKRGVELASDRHFKRLGRIARGFKFICYAFCGRHFQKYCEGKLAKTIDKNNNIDIMHANNKNMKGNLQNVSS